MEELDGSKEFTAFVPKMLPPQIYYDGELVMLLSEAEGKIGELKGYGDCSKSLKRSSKNI